MNELRKSDNNYTISKDEHFYNIKTDGILRFEAAYYNESTDTLTLALSRYKNDLHGLCDTEYMLIDNKYTILDVVTETEGVTPSFICAPDSSLWVIMSSSNSNRSKNSILSIYNRNKIVKEKLFSSFVSTTQEIYKGSTYHFFTDIYTNKKQDKICHYLFNQDNLFLKRKCYKLPLPNNCRSIIRNGKLHLINKMYGLKIMHRECTLEGNVINSRIITFDLDYSFIYPISISSDNKITFLVTKLNKVYQLKIDSNGNMIEKILLSTFAKCSEYLYNVWKPVVLDERTYAVKYSHDSATGYIVVKNDIIKESWSKYYNRSVIKNELNNEEIDLESYKLTISGIYKLGNHKIAIIYTAINVEAKDKLIKIYVSSI